MKKNILDYTLRELIELNCVETKTGGHVSKVEISKFIPTENFDEANIKTLRIKTNFYGDLDFFLKAPTKIFK